MTIQQVLVTGSEGALGKHIVRELQAQRHTVTGFDQKPGGSGCESLRTGDITDLASVREACAQMDAVIHVAARPNIWSGASHEIIHTNTLGTWNVLQAAEEAGVKRVILCSSDSVYGFTVTSGSMRPPEYVPMDSDHTARPTDPYGLSKLLGEQIGRSFADRGKIEVIALRPVFVLYEEMYGEVRARSKNPAAYKGPMVGGPTAAGGGPLWHYVDPRDVARAFRLAIEAPSLPRFEGLIISAKTTLAPDPTLARLEQYVGREIKVRDPGLYQQNPYAPLFDLSPAQRVLGFEAEFDLRDAMRSTNILS